MTSRLINIQQFSYLSPKQVSVEVKTTKHFYATVRNIFTFNVYYYLFQQNVLDAAAMTRRHDKLIHLRGSLQQI